MATWTEYDDCFAVEIHRSHLHPESLVEVDLGDGIAASFGEPRSKLGSGRYKLIEIAFDKATWDFDRAVDWWRDHDVRAFQTGKHGLNQTLPPVSNSRHGAFLSKCTFHNQGSKAKDKTPGQAYPQRGF